MNIIELMEGTQPKLPGAFKGVQVMTPQQFVAKSAEGEEPNPEEKCQKKKTQCGELKHLQLVDFM